MKMKLNFDYKQILAYLRLGEPYIVGVLLIGIFGYTAYFINAALNVKPAKTATTTASLNIVFDKTTVQAVKNINVVSGQVPAVNLGKSDPFGG
jgi:hypothetical protein